LCTLRWSLVNGKVFGRFSVDFEKWDIAPAFFLPRTAQPDTQS
jgi:hypothetical protein